jgi:hypothetical protein
VGYCYGAKHVIDLAKENTIASAVVAHPSRFDVPGNLHELVAKSKAPLLINSCEVLNMNSITISQVLKETIFRSIPHSQPRRANKQTRFWATASISPVTPDSTG